MTVSAQTPINQHTANGSTYVFAYTFKILDDADLSVYLDDVLQTSGFAVSGVGAGAGGTVTFTTAPASGTVVSLIRDVELVRETDYQNAGDFLAGTVNTDFDRIWMAIQQLKSTADQRALLFSETAVRTAIQNRIPDPVSGTLLQWQADGSIGNIGISSIGSALTFGSAEIVYDSMAAALASSDNVASMCVRSFYSGAGIGRAYYRRTATAQTPTTTTTLATILTDLKQGFIVNAAGVRYDLEVSQIRDVYQFGAKGDWNGSTGTDDSDAIEAAIGNSDFTGTAPGREVWFWKLHLISRTVEIPPNCWLVGAGGMHSTNLTGAGICGSQNGVILRAVRRNAAPGSLFHKGGIRFLSIATTAGGIANTKLLELGDFNTVTTSVGAWNFTVFGCVFNFCTTGYGIYSAHSQEALIQWNWFRSVKYPVYYNTVMASVRIENNTFLDESAISGAVAIFLRYGSLGGSSGGKITGNYSIGFDEFLRAVSVHGVMVQCNQIEGCRLDAVHLSRYLLGNTTAEGSGCYGFDITANTFINFAAGGGSHCAIKLDYSNNNNVGINTYQSPAATAASCVGWYDGGTAYKTENNIVRLPVVTGNNTSVPALPAASAVSQQNMVVSPDFVQLRVNVKGSLPSATYKGRIIYVDDEAGGAVLAFSDGTNWRRVTDRAVVS